jgi:hypothetical protein
MCVGRDLDAPRSRPAERTRQTFVCATRDVERKRSFDAFFVLDAVRDANEHVVAFTYSELNARAEALLARHRSTVLGGP